MTPKKVSNCCGAKYRYIPNGGSGFYRCLSCSQPCTPVEAKSETLIMDPLGRVQKVSPKIKSAREVKEEDFKKIIDGEWVQPIRNGYLFKCCDCELVHSMDFRIVKSGRGSFIQFRATRKPRSIASPAPRPAGGWIKDFDEKFIEDGGWFGWRNVYPDDVKSFFTAELAKKDEQIKQAREEGYQSGLKDRSPSVASVYGFEAGQGFLRVELREKIEKMKRTIWEEPAISSQEYPLQVFNFAVEQILSLLDQEDKPNPPRE